ncbi:MAG: SDR family NAD(P)-dependent oxidoreductase [Myxococcota bacterium]
MRTVLITGGSSGLGLALSRRFAAQGDRLLWVSQDAQQLEHAQQTMRASYPDAEIHVLTCDLRDDDASETIHAWATGIGVVDVLVNNAGFGSHGAAWTIPEERELAVIQVNAVALYRLTRRFLPEMIERDAGMIINISSNSSFQPVPRMAIYAATKGFVTQFSRALTEELRMQGAAVKVMTVCPAAIRDTAFRTVNEMDRVRTFDGLATTTTDEVVGDIWDGIQRQEAMVVSGWRQRALMWLRPFLPHALTMAIVQRETASR